MTTLSEYMRQHADEAERTYMQWLASTTVSREQAAEVAGVPWQRLLKSMRRHRIDTAWTMAIGAAVARPTRRRPERAEPVVRQVLDEEGVKAAFGPPTKPKRRPAETYSERHYAMQRSRGQAHDAYVAEFAVDAATAERLRTWFGAEEGG